MNLQYITNMNGEPSGVIIPIKDWERIREKLGPEVLSEIEIPEWHESILSERIEAYKSGETTFRDAELVLKEIEKNL